MAVGLSTKAIQSLSSTVKTPNVVIEIENLDTPLSARVLYSSVRIGVGDLEIGDPEVNPLSFYIGGGHSFADQKTIVNLAGSSSSIKQTLNIDKGEGSSVSSLTIELQDDNYATKLITPGELLTDILAQKCRVWMAPDENLFWPEDFALIFRGIISDVDSSPGRVVLNLTAPESKKRSTLFKINETKLNGAINGSATTIVLDSTADMLQKVLGPDGLYDGSIGTYIRIDDEIIQYDTISGNSLLGCTRARFGTAAASHSDNADVSAFYRIFGNPITLALKLMLSGNMGPWVESLTVGAFNTFESMTVPNSIYFPAENVSIKYGLSVGDYISTSGATNGANNVSLKRVTEINVASDGTYIVVDGVSFVNETASPALCSFRSQYDVWPEGLAMGGDEVDIDAHVTLYNRFFSSTEVDFYIKEEINGREFLDTQIYLPISCYSIPRQSRVSVGYHIGPLPGDRTVTLDRTNVKLSQRSNLKRSISRNFYNEIIYKYEQSAVEDKYKSGFIVIAQDSKNQIPAGNKTLIINANGFRDLLSGDNIALQAANRKLKRYKFGAESLKISTLLSIGFDIEIGDIVIYDGTTDFLPDIKRGARGIEPRLFEVQNKTMDLKSGNVEIELIDTNFSLTSRYGLISPSSVVVSGASTTSFTIPSSETSKWSRYTSTSIRVRSEDGSTIDDTVVQSVSSGVVTVLPALAFTPSAGMIMELSLYNDVDVTEEIKLRYAHMRDTAFSDGKTQYLML